MKFAAKIKKKLLSDISLVAGESENFVIHPGKDFSRKGKLPLESILRYVINLSDHSTYEDRMDFFDHQIDAPTQSAIIQARDKIKPEIFIEIIERFNEKSPQNKKWNGYYLFAQDGSDFSIFKDPTDKSTYLDNSKTENGHNHIHLDALYDLCNHTYQKVKVTPRLEANEKTALFEFMDSYSFQEKTIITADRNYETYNVLAHFQENNLFYVIRGKDIDSNGIVSTMKYPNESFDHEIVIHLGRSKKALKNIKEGYKKQLNTTQELDYLPKENKNDVYVLKTRVLRFPIGENKYELIWTNLPQETISSKEIKALYGKRWGIETSFRQLKYAVSATKLHSKKINHIYQEIYAKILLYNFCEVITGHILFDKRTEKHTYCLNYTRAIKECIYYFKFKGKRNVPDVEALIKKNLSVVRPGRQFRRKVQPRRTMHFLYR